VSKEFAPKSRGTWWLRLVGPIAAVVLLWRVDVQEVGASLAEVRARPLAWSLLLVGPLFVIKAWRWRLLLDACGVPISLLEASRLYAIAAGAGSITPGAVGDFWKGLMPAVGSRSIGLWTSALDRLYDVILLLLLGFGVAVGWMQSGTQRLLAASLLVAAVAGGWSARGRLLHFAASFLPRFPPATSALYRSIAPACTATMLAALIAFARFELLVEALGIRLEWQQIFVAFVLSSGAAALPLSVAGLGTRDIALVGYLRRCGVTSVHAIALSSLCLLLFLWNGVVAGCLWFAKPAALKIR
jgi:uncharacterized membrane protein YbhN (UPF0104 family)